jgi:hypothetical protein
LSRLLLGVALWCISLGACAAGGPLGIDHRVNLEESGIWSREIQKAVFYGSMVTSVSGALIEGTETRVGLTFWRAAESGGIAALEAGVLKKVFTRPRPSQINDPDLWFPRQWLSKLSKRRDCPGDGRRDAVYSRVRARISLASGRLRRFQRMWPLRE